MNTVSVPDRSPYFTHLNFRSLRLQPPPVSRRRFYTLPLSSSSIPICSGLGFTTGSQARQTWSAESSSLTYGWTVRLLLLPTPPHDDAVAVGYRPENVYLEGTFTPLFSTTQCALVGARTAGVPPALAARSTKRLGLGRLAPAVFRLGLGRAKACPEKRGREAAQSQSFRRPHRKCRRSRQPPCLDVDHARVSVFNERRRSRGRGSPVTSHEKAEYASF
jgi:hypothetical protein